MDDAKVNDFIEHAGVKGMKWGKRKARPSSADIRGARQRQADRMDKIDVRIKDNASEKTIMKAIDSFARQQDKVLSHPDAKTAALMTRGEKAVRNTQVAAVVVVGVGIAARAIAKG